MTQKQKAEAYDKAFKEAKRIHEFSSDVAEIKRMEQIFPELKMSEGEKIKKELCEDIWTFIPHEKAHKYINWLEKQGDNCPVNFDEAEKEKYDFVSGQFIECRKSFNEFKEDNSYWFEYVGDDTYIGRSDNILNQKFHITPRQLYCLFTQQHFPKEDSNVNDETNAPTGYGKYVDECLNEASKHFFSDGEDKYSVANLFYAGVRCGKYWFEKQGEQKPADKIEPKFKNGQWIVWQNKCYKVNYNGCGYELIDQNGLSTSLEYVTVDENAHLWTIQDAKDGDVLVEDKILGYPSPFIAIFKTKDSVDTFSSHCFIGFNRNFYEGEVGHCSENLHPATKEERDLLFQKMKENGYEWDTEKKHLKQLLQHGSDR